MAFYGFPKTQPQFFTMIEFAKYFRPTPSSSVTQSTAMTVRLPLPNNLTDQYGVEVNSTTLDLLGNLPTTMDMPTGGDLLAAGQSIQNKVDEQYNAGGVMGIMKNVTGGALALTPGISDMGVSKLFQSNLGIVRNPHITTLFEGVKLKSFTFTWKLSPKSPEEAAEMKQMVTLIKGYMHPMLKGPGGFALEYPYLAKVNFNTGDSNTLMPNVNWSFLSALEIDSTTAGIPAFYRDGQPVTITLGMQFVEINIRTREDFISTDSASSLYNGGRER